MNEFSGSVGKPVGTFLSDFHGIVSANDAEFDLIDILRACKLIAWDFAHVPLSQSYFRRWIDRTLPSSQINLDGGYANYIAGKRASGSDLIERVAYKERRLGREIGPITFLTNECNTSVLDKVLTWKSAQYVRTGLFDFLRPSWTRALLRNMHQIQTEAFAGVLSALYAGDHLVAGHFGIRSRNVLHHWFHSYDPAFGKYSPGLVLTLKTAENAPQLKIRVIDLGGEMQPFKARFATGSVTLAAGSVALPALASVPHRLKRQLSTLVQKSPLKAPALAIKQKWRSVTGEP